MSEAIDTSNGRQVLPCPACSHPLALEAGLTIPSVPNGVVWQCGRPACKQVVILTLVKDKASKEWKVHALKFTPAASARSHAP